MNDEIPVACIFEPKEGLFETHHIKPSHIRNAHVVIVNGRHFAFCGVGMGTARFYEIDPPVEIQTATAAMYPKVAPTLQTHSGRMVPILDPDIEDINLQDIAHSLSMLCRYNGHTKKFYSVAEHSVLICRWLLSVGEPAHVQKVGLIHDAPEYLTGDVTKPLKSVIAPLYRPIQNRLWSLIAMRFDLMQVIPNIVHEADVHILMNEKRDGLAHDVNWGWETDPLPDVHLKFWAPEEAERQFLRECQRLGIE